MQNYPSPVAATPCAKRLAAEWRIDLAQVRPGRGRREVRAADVRGYRAAVRATPLARRVAAERGIALEGVTGTGHAGKVLRDDLLTATANTPAAHQPAQPVAIRHKMSGMRKIIAQRMTASHLEIPPVTQNIEVDVTELLRLRASYNEGREKAERLSVNDFVIRALAIAVREMPRCRMRLDDGVFEEYEAVNIGVAVGLDEGLIVPVIRNADQKHIAQLSAEAKALAKRARAGTLTVEEYGDGTITISNVGMFGIHSFTPIINQPEAAILGVCAATDRLVLENGSVAVHQIMMLCLTFDHRILNGTEACALEQRLKALLEKPVALMA